MKRNGVPVVFAKDRKSWREWLARNHQTEKSVWLVMYHKESVRASVYYHEAVEEAICFGWIDSKPNKRDEESYFQYFARRNPNSNWSRFNKEKVIKLLEAGMMAEAGLEMVRKARENGTWNALDNVENLTIPPDLREAFHAKPAAWKNFEAFPRSVKRSILEWIFNAKRPVTRQKRIDETVHLAADNKRANQYRG